MDPFGYASVFASSLHDPQAFERAYNDWLGELLRRPLWSPSDPEGRRIPWRQVNLAIEAFPDAFGSPGLYMFSSAEGVPRYIGLSKGRRNDRPLKERLRRYVPVGKPKHQRSQCELAAQYAKEVSERGIDGFPEEIRDWYRKNYRKSTVRLVGAIDFAKHGAEGIWFTLLPTPNADLIPELEQHLISTANRWNVRHGHPPLCNAEWRKSQYRTHLDGPRPY